MTLKSAHKTHGLLHLCCACRYSYAGWLVACGETAFRHELLAGIVLLPAAWLLPFSLQGTLLLNLGWLALLVVEVLNTAIEAVVDLASPEHHPLAGKAKDLGSLAVGLTILGNVVAWAFQIMTIM